MRYRNKHPSVDSFIFSIDSEFDAPEWFCRAVQTERISIDRAIHDGATRIYGCSIKTSRGILHAKCGDHIVMLTNGIILPFVKSEMNILFERQVDSMACKGSGGKKGKGGKGK